MFFGAWPQLFEPEHRDLLKAAARADDLAEPATVTQLRRYGSAELVRAAIELTLARRKAAEKFPEPAHLLSDVTGIEQASSLDVARHKARRFAEAGLDYIVDLCCGIGGDAMALAEVADVALIDSSPPRLWMARHNVQAVTGKQCPAAVADVTKLNLDGRAFHLDPDRRTGRRRLVRYADYRPGPDFIERLVDRGGDGAVKLSPAVDLEALPPGEVEVINRRGTLVQAVLWTGTLARAERTATRVESVEPGRPLDGGGMPPDRGAPIHTLSGSTRPIPVASPSGYLLAVDPAVERAGLMGLLCEQLNVGAIHPALGLLTASQPPDSAWVTPFQLIETMPWRPKKVKRWLAAHDGGLVEVKTRDQAVDPDRVQKQLRGDGTTPYTLFILRQERQVLVYVTRRV